MEMDKNRGLYEKYIVRRADNKDMPGQKHYGCRYFVLDMTHDVHAIPALWAYAWSVVNTNPTLCREILDFIDERVKQIENAGGKE